MTGHMSPGDLSVDSTGNTTSVSTHHNKPDARCVICDQHQNYMKFIYVPNIVTGTVIFCVYIFPIHILLKSPGAYYTQKQG